mgnify:CR=1 FL=1
MNYAIIAAGEGSRLAQEGVAKPKPLVELCGEPMIGRLINLFTRCNAESISVIVNEQMTEVREYLEALKLEVPFQLVVKSTPSSMHSFYELSRVMKPGRFCLTTVDTIFREEDFRKYIQAMEADLECDGMMAVTPYIDDEKPLYVQTDGDLNITASTPYTGNYCLSIWHDGICQSIDVFGVVTHIFISHTFCTTSVDADLCTVL